jgi:hypothetical protein
MLAGVFVIQLFQGVGFMMAVCVSNLPINKHILAALFVLLKWALLVIPFALLLWLPIARREFFRRVAARWLSHPIITSICLLAVPAIVLMLFTAPFSFAGTWGRTWGPMTNEASARFQTANLWAAYGFYLAHDLVVPIALVYLARWQLKSEITSDTFGT